MSLLSFFRRRVVSVLAAILACALLPSLRADVSLGTPFRNGAIVQREKPLQVWGSANPGEHVAVEFHGQSARTVAGADSNWKVRFRPFAASAEPAEMIVTGQNRVVVENVLIGEVWLCSGQSNMYVPVKTAQNAAAEIRAANHPLIREFAPQARGVIKAANEADDLIRSNLADEPRESFVGEWRTCSPETVGRFSATGYFFAREVQRRLGNVPIGIIKATLGGSPIEGWIGKAAYDADSAFGYVPKEWEEIRPKITDVEGMRRQPSALYNGLIYPLRQYSIRGFLWYQGEANVEQADKYPGLFSALIREWRGDFEQGNLPFIFVQLPGYAGPHAGAKGQDGTAWPLQREAQATALQLPNVRMVVTIDIGDAVQLHPPNKQEVGRRAALVALANVYGEQLEFSGPLFTDVVREGSALRLTFSHAEGLRFVNDPSRVFEVAGADHRYVPAHAQIEGRTVLVSAKDVAEPIAVRCEWRNLPDSFLVNDAGLPAAPFCTDNR